MGELFSGKSATCPTFWRSRSVLTRIDLQNSQTVCTLLDQRNTIFAPQFGQLTAGWLIPCSSPQKRLPVPAARGRESPDLGHIAAPASEPRPNGQQIFSLNLR